MSRAINIDASETDVLATCLEKGVTISAIEVLLSGGTRVVLNNAIDTATIKKAYGTKVLNSPVRRSFARLARQRNQNS